MLFLFSNKCFSIIEDIINFIKQSDKTIIKLAKFDSDKNVYILNENDDENYYIVVDNIKNTFELNQLKNIKTNIYDSIDVKF